MESKNLNFTRLLITGEMRSGTTFLANFLNSQEGIVLYADMLLSLFNEARELKVKDINQTLGEREQNILLNNLVQEGRKESLKFKKIQRKEGRTWLQIFNQAMLILDNEIQSMIVGVKKTRQEEYLGQLLNDGVKVIYCIRDPRDVIVSSSNRFSTHSTFGSVKKWEQSVKNALNLRSHDNMHFVRFEDLILKKEATVNKLSDFLGTTLTTNLTSLKYGASGRYQDNSSFGDVQQLFDPTAVNRWKKQDNAAEYEFCSYQLSELMEKMGYEPNTELGTAGKRLVDAFAKSERRAKIKSFLKEMIGKYIA